MCRKASKKLQKVFFVKMAKCLPTVYSPLKNKKSTLCVYKQKPTVNCLILQVSSPLSVKVSPYTTASVQGIYFSSQSPPSRRPNISGGIDRSKEQSSSPNPGVQWHCPAEIMIERK